MADYRTIPAAELGKGSNIKVELCETEVDLYWKMAIEVLELIQENNAKGEKTVMIVPYGPLGPYARLVELIRKIHSSMYHQLQVRGYAAPVDVLIDTGILPKQKHEDWRFGRVRYLEAVCNANLKRCLLYTSPSPRD